MVDKFIHMVSWYIISVLVVGLKNKYTDKS